MERIYLDYAATTPVLPEAKEAMQPWLSDRFGNPSSLYAEGREAKAAIDSARETISRALGCLFGEVIFTSGGTEAANLAILGAALGNTDRNRKRILMSTAEHHCVLATKPLLERLGFTVELVFVDEIGRLRHLDLEARMGRDVLLVSAMHANNELGTLQPVKEIAALAHSHRALFHCDAVQTFTTQRWNVDKLGADLVSISAHKLGGPKGVGALYIKSGTPMKHVIVGGGQERDMRAGTENVAGIVGFAAAVKHAMAADPSTRNDHKLRLRNLFVSGLDRTVFRQTVSDPLDTLPGFAHVRALGIEAETMLIRLDRTGVSASSGAACSSGSVEPSHVLLACGLAPNEAKEGLRFTFGVQSTAEEARRAAEIANEAAEYILAVR